MKEYGFWWKFGFYWKHGFWPKWHHIAFLKWLDMPLEKMDPRIVNEQARIFQKNPKDPYQFN